MKKNVLIACLCLISLNSLFAQDSFKVMFYNLLNFPYQTNATNRINDLEVILNDYQPDIFMVCELNNIEGANSILQMIQQNINPNFAMATFVDNTSDDAGSDQNDLQNLMFYDSSKFSIDSEAIISTTIRDFNHYKLKLNTNNQVASPIFLDLVVCHLKSASGTTNQNKRLAMVQQLTSYLNNIPNDSYVLLGGDLNLYRSTEPAFIELTNTTNNITFTDPANRLGNWTYGDAFLDVFTQSTRSQTGGGGASGGFDDRFDFILSSTNLLDYSNNSELVYSPNTYQAYGNNSNQNCYNKDINSADCDIDGDINTPDFSLQIRNALYNFSDHLPVTLELQLNQTFLSVPEFNASNFYEIIGTNITSNQLHLRANANQINSNKLYIYNPLGQIVKTIILDNTDNHRINVSTLSNGLYYITTPNLNVEPLKFIKSN
ncbi:MAG: hypothetical protein ACPG6B_04100 [Oceanihabitans sp.]